ncbi:TPA: hypothetical protein DEP90_01140 [Patescibacteria group bacterium]|nr:hypothetical protein [Patescibacteria group bacterium]
MITKNKQSKFKAFFGKVLEPIALGLLALLFIIPSITVINLEPITKNIKKITDILGVTTSSEVIVDLVGGTHEILSIEKIYKDGDDGYIYNALLTKRESDFYSKPILQLRNNSEKDKILTFLGTTLSPTRSEIGLIINDQAYRLQRATGESESIEILLKPKSKYDVYLTVESVVGVQFSEEFEMKIGVR